MTPVGKSDLMESWHIRASHPCSGSGRYSDLHWRLSRGISSNEKLFGAPKINIWQKINERNYRRQTARSDLMERPRSTQTPSLTRSSLESDRISIRDPSAGEITPLLFERRKPWRL